MSHYEEQRERYYADMAAHLQGEKAGAEALHQSALEQAIDAATAINNRDLLSGLTAAIERLAGAVELLANARSEIILSRDHGDAPMTFTPDALSSLYAGQPPLSPRPALIEAIKRVSWFGCTHRKDLGSDDLIMTVSSERATFEKLADLVDMTPAALREALKGFDRYERGPSYHRVSFPAAWVRSA